MIFWNARIWYFVFYIITIVWSMLSALSNGVPGRSDGVCGRTIFYVTYTFRTFSINSVQGRCLDTRNTTLGCTILLGLHKTVGTVVPQDLVAALSFNVSNAPAICDRVCRCPVTPEVN